MSYTWVLSTLCCVVTLDAMTCAILRTKIFIPTSSFPNEARGIASRHSFSAPLRLLEWLSASGTTQIEGCDF